MIHILIPGNSWHHRVVSAWSQSQSWLSSNEISWELLTGYSSDIYRLRNYMADQALSNGAEIIIWIDSDIVWTRDQFVKLVQLSYSHAVISGWYYDRNGLIAAGRFDDQCSRYGLSDMSGEMLHAGWVGHGFFAIQANVYRALPQPWYTYQSWHGITIGEDIGLCKSIADNGYSIHIASDLRVLHKKEFFI